jgi:hypothetical protein
MDPLSGVLSLLKPQNTMFGGFDVGGDWSLPFPEERSQKKGVRNRKLESFPEKRGQEPKAPNRFLTPLFVGFDRNKYHFISRFCNFIEIARTQNHTDDEPY